MVKIWKDSGLGYIKILKVSRKMNMLRKCGKLFTASNGYEIHSGYFPEVTGYRIYLAGYNKYDDDTLITIKLSEFEPISLALREFSIYMK